MQFLEGGFGMRGLALSRGQLPIFVERSRRAASAFGPAIFGIKDVGLGSRWDSQIELWDWDGTVGGTGDRGPNPPLYSLLLCLPKVRGRKQ